MDPAILSKLLANSPLIAMILGLLAALKYLRSEWLEREKLWRDILDKKAAEHDALLKENLTALREQIKTNVEFAEELKAIREMLRAMPTGGV